MNKRIDYDVSGQRFNRLTIRQCIGRDKRGRQEWECLCDCGTTKAITSVYGLRRGLIKSCGCLLKENRKTFGTKHNMSYSLTYANWTAMLARCRNPNAKNYPAYGALGIRVHKAWEDFTVFLQDMGERPTPEHSLDRWPDKNGNYEPGNCRWATRSEQSRNRRHIRSVIRSDGIRFSSMIEAAEFTGCSRRIIGNSCAGRTKNHSGYSWSYAP